MSYVVVAKDCDGHHLSTGGDIIRVEAQQTFRATSRDERTCSVEVTDNNNGAYTIRITPQRHGEYSFDVLADKAKVQQCLSIRCCPTATLFTFDPSECQRENTISEDKLTMTCSDGHNEWSSVLGREGMQTGQHVWKVKVSSCNPDSMYLFFLV